MTRLKPFHSLPSKNPSVNFSAIVSGLALVTALSVVMFLCPQPAFAQHGGGGGHMGGGGGGHFGGGGPTHFGGGGGNTGGGVPRFSGTPAPHTPAAPAHASAPPAPRIPQAPPAPTYHVASPGIIQNVAPLNGAMVTPAPGSAPRSSTVIGFPPSNTAAWQALLARPGNSASIASTPSTSSTPATGALRLSGQGSTLWREPVTNAPTNAPVNSIASRAPITYRSATSQQTTLGSPRNTSQGFAGVRFGGGSVNGAIVGRPHPIWPPRGFNPRFYQPFYPYGFYPFGLGFGWGGYCDPFDSWSFGCNNGGYGYNGYGGYGGIYSSPTPYVPYDPYEFSGPNAGPYPEQYQGNAMPQTPYNGPYGGTQNNADNSPLAVLFLNDGTVYEVSDYWVMDGRLHYVIGGREESIALSDLDMQKTVNVNAQRGVPFTLLPGPAAPPQPANPGTGNGSSAPTLDEHPQSAPAPNSPTRLQVQ